MVLVAAGRMLLTCDGSSLDRSPSEVAILHDSNIRAECHDIVVPYRPPHHSILKVLLFELRISPICYVVTLVSDVITGFWL